MAQALLRKLTDVQTADALDAIVTTLKARRITPKVHSHWDGERWFWRVYVRNTDLSGARTIVKAREFLCQLNECF